MKIDPNVLERLRQRVASTFTVSPRTPGDFDMLTADIFRRTGRRISASTLKRIWGYVESPHGTSYSSLTILSRYVGYNDWEVFCLHESDNTNNSPSQTSGFGKDSILACHILELNTIIELSWLPDKSCRLQKIGEPDLFKVVKSTNTKMLEGFTGHINSLQVGCPVIFTDCRNGDTLMGTYHGASAGLVAIAIID